MIQIQTKAGTVDYLPELPNSAIYIGRIFIFDVKEQTYWFDIKNKRLIKKNHIKDKHPYRYLRGHTLKIYLKDRFTVERNLSSTCKWIWEQWDRDY